MESLAQIRGSVDITTFINKVLGPFTSTDKYSKVNALFVLLFAHINGAGKGESQHICSIVFLPPTH